MWLLRSTTIFLLVQEVGVLNIQKGVDPGKDVRVVLGNTDFQTHAFQPVDGLEELPGDDDVRSTVHFTQGFAKPCITEDLQVLGCLVCNKPICNTLREQPVSMCVLTELTPDWYSL